MLLSFCFQDEIFHLSWRDKFGRLWLSVRADSQVIVKSQYRFSEHIEVGGSLLVFSFMTRPSRLVVRSSTCERAFWAHDVQDPAI
jgi:hypothetical protein